MKKLLALLETLGAITDIVWRSVLALRDIKKIPPLVWEQMSTIGVNSLPLVCLTSVFTGMVTAVQIAYQIKDYAPMDLLGAGVSKMVMIELGPVLTALIVAGRVGAGISAELGTMRVTEQIDALECMAIDSIRFLILPRLIAGVIMLPILTIFYEVVSIVGASFVSNTVVHIQYTEFFQGIKLFFDARDLFGGLSKSFVFGFAIALMGSFYGYNAEGGAVGVGKATTRAVVAASLLILVADYFLGVLIFGE